MNRPIILLFSLLAAAIACAAQTSSPITAIGADYWRWVLDNNIEQRMRAGLKVERLPGVTSEKSRTDAAFAQSLLGRLHRLNRSALSHDEQISYGVLEFEARSAADGAPYYWLRFLVTPYASPIPLANRALSSYQFAKQEDLAGYLALLDQYLVFLDGIRANLEGQVSRRILIPKPEIEPVRRFLSTFIKQPEHSVFYVAAGRLGRFDSEKFRESVAAVIRGQINLRLQALVDWLGGDYLRKAPEQAGMSQYPNGKAYYEYAVRFHTSLNITPEEVHRIGLTFVDETEAKMEQTRVKLGYGGRKAEFTRHIKTDPRFFPKRPEEMGAKMAGFIDRIRPKLGLMFLHLPRAEYAIERLDPAMEGAQTYGIYHQPIANERRGIYYFNGSDLKNRTLLSAGALIYHELMPGHHLQFNLQRENNNLPEFRRYGYYTAHGEGWACYATVIAEELGMYPDPYDYYGYLAMNMFYSVRLVVDTGMNYLGWSRERAMGYMREHLIESETQIATESLRYSVDLPAQALAYRMGAREMLELRERYRRASGPRYDIRRFHDWVLSIGSVPLPVLEKHIDWEIAREH